MDPGIPESQLADLSELVVLVVDDDDDCRELLAAVLESRHAEVLEASSAEEGLSYLLERRPGIVVSDIAMPGEDGYSFIRRVRSLPLERGGAVPAIALTAFSQPRDRQEALSAGFSSHMAKPVDLALLCRQIVRLSRGAAEAALEL